MFYSLNKYARCSCQALKEFEDLGLKGGLEFFGELTEMVEAIFLGFRTGHKEKCPPWSFSCNDNGDAILDTYEIVCPLELDQERVKESSRSYAVGDSVDIDIDENEYLQDIISKVHDGVEALTPEQVYIDDVENTNSTITVIMYSEEDARNAADWLSLNTTDDLPPEIKKEGCTLNDEIIQENLNEIFGDVTPAPTDNCTQKNIMFMMLYVCIMLYFVS